MRNESRSCRDIRKFSEFIYLRIWYFRKGNYAAVFSAKRKSTRVFRAEQQCVDRILCNAEHFFTGFMFVFDDKRNFFTGGKRCTLHCSDSGKQLCAVQRSIGTESEANLLRTNGESQNAELSCAGFIQCNIQQILD